ncbi:hypothetical protein [Actinoplanes sp. NPDC020271]|uniref:hypothetical protein n=1 Tax=Actinoplanes sp. NPDC020271 TaxID=3363896 RepID=UPI0037ADB79A
MPPISWLAAGARHEIQNAEGHAHPLRGIAAALAGNLANTTYQARCPEYDLID